METKAKANHTVTLQLRDANYKEVASKEVTTDDFGTATADFELPKSGLTGRFSIIARYGNNGSTFFNVEEYKRPTFEVEFDKYEKKYAVGDTIKVKGRAKAIRESRFREQRLNIPSTAAWLYGGGAAKTQTNNSQVVR